MSKIFIEESTLTAIGDSIRDKTGKQDLISPLNMPTEIKSIKGGNIIKTVSGTCPITLENCVEGNLLDYKIYGAEGGVGEPTKNIFSIKNVTGNNIRVEQNANYPGVEFLHFVDSSDGLVITGNFKENTQYTLRTLLHRYSGSTAKHANYRWYYTDGTTSVNRLFGIDTISTSTSDADKTVQKIAVSSSYSSDALLDLSVTQIEEGTVATEFEPSGYVIPLKINDTAYKTYIGMNQLGTGDYLDYENRCMVKSDGTKTHLDLPEIHLVEGTNTFNVETTVKPSNVQLSYVKSIEFNTMKTVKGTLPLTVEGVGQRLEDYKIYGAYGDALHYGDANEYIGYDYITTKQSSSGVSNKAGFNSGIQWKEVNKIRFSIRNNTTQENNMIFAAKATSDNECSSLNSPWIGLGQVKYQSQALTNLTSENHPEPGVFGIDTLKFTTPTSTNYIWVASWMDSAWSRNNDWGFIEFYKDDTLVAAFYPAKRVSDGVFGFYNTVSGDFITCNASETAFVGNAELSNSVGDLSGNHYIIPININGSVINIESTSLLGENDYIDFENRAIVKEGVSSYLNLPDIYLQNGQNVIDVDTTVKPSKMSISFVDDIFDSSHIVTKPTEISCENTGTIYRSACEQIIKQLCITNPSGTFAYRWNQLNDNGYISKPTTQNGVTFTNAGNGKLVLSGTTTNRVLMPVVSSSFMSTWNTSHKYYLRKLHPISSNTTIYWHTYNKLVVSGIFLGSEMNFAANYPRVSIAPNYDATGIEITPQIFDLTAMFGEGNEPTQEQFDAMFTENYYSFNEGTDIYNLPITINGVTINIKYNGGETKFYPEDKIIIPEGDSNISLPGTLSGIYLMSVSK